MLPLGAPGDAHDAAPRPHIPVGCAQTGEGGHKVNAAVVGYLLGVILRIPALAEQPQLIPQPLDDRTAHKDRAFQRVLHGALGRGGQRRDKAVFALKGFFAGVHQQKAAGAIGILGFARRKAGLPEQSSLLVAGHARNGHLHALDLCGAVDLAGRANLRQHGTRDVQSLEQRVIPVQPMDIVEHGAGGVGAVGGMDRAAGQLPEQPAVHGAEEDLPLLCPLLCARHLIEDPADLGGGEVRIRQQAGGLPDVVGQPLRHQLIHEGGCPAALPDDGVVDGCARGFIPQDGGLPLVGDADGRKICRPDVALGDDLHHHGVLAGPDLHGVVLHPALFRVKLGKLLLADGHDVLRLIKQDGPGAGRSLIEGEDVLWHKHCLLNVFSTSSITDFAPDEKPPEPAFCCANHTVFLAKFLRVTKNSSKNKNFTLQVF